MENEFIAIRKAKIENIQKLYNHFVMKKASLEKEIGECNTEMRDLRKQHEKLVMEIDKAAGITHHKNWEVKKGKWVPKK